MTEKNTQIFTLNEAVKYNGVNARIIGIFLDINAFYRYFEVNIYLNEYYDTIYKGDGWRNSCLYIIETEAPIPNITMDIFKLIYMDQLMKLNNLNSIQDLYDFTVENSNTFILPGFVLEKMNG